MRKNKIKKITSLITLIFTLLTNTIPSAELLAQTTTDQASRTSADNSAYQQDLEALNQARQLDADVSSCLSAYSWASPSNATQAGNEAAQSLPINATATTRPGETTVEGQTASIDDKTKIDPRNNFKTTKNWSDFSSLDQIADYMDETYYNNDVAGGDIPNFLREIEEMGGTLSDLQNGYDSINDLVQDINGLQNIEDFNNILQDIRDVGGTFEELRGSFGGISSMIDFVSSNFTGRIGDLGQVFDSLGNMTGSLEEMLSGYNDIKDLITDIGNIDSLADLSGVLSNLGDLGDSFSDIVSGFDGLKGLITKLGNFADLGGLSSMLSSISDLGGSLDQLLSGFGNVSNLFSQLGNISNLADLGDLFRSIGDIGGSFADLLNQAGSASELISSLSGMDLGSIADFVTNFGEMGGNLTQLLSGFKDLGDFASKLSSLGNIAQLSSSLSSLSDLSGGLSSLLSSSGGMSGALGSLSSVIGGQYVPVHETGQLLSYTGQLLAVSQTSDTNLGQSRDLLVKLCVHVKAIRRIEMAMEKSKFVDEPDMRRQAASKVAEYSQGITGEQGLIKTGYKPSGELAETASSSSNTGTINKASLFPENLNYYMADARNEGYLVFMDNFNNYSNNIFKDGIKEQFEEDQKVLDRASYNSSISREEYDTFMDREKSKKLSPQEYWASFNSVYDINRSNNPMTAYMYAKEALESSEEVSKQVAMAEYNAGNGFLPVRDCLIYSSDGKSCSVWKTITPGSVIAKTANEALGTKLEQYLHPELGQVGEGNEPLVTDISNFISSLGTGGGGTGGSSGGSSGGEDGNSETETKPEVQIRANRLLNNNRRIIWSSNNTTSCKAKNNWLGSTNSVTKILDVVKNSGDDLGTSGELVFALPLNFRLSWSKNNGTFSTSGVSSSTTSTSTSVKYNWNVVPRTSKSDTYTLKIEDDINPTGLTITVGPDDDLTAKRAIELFKNHQLVYPNLEIYRRYNITYNNSGNIRDIKVEVRNPVYQISCLGKNGDQVTDTVTP